MVGIVFEFLPMVKIYRGFGYCTNKTMSIKQFLRVFIILSKQEIKAHKQRLHWIEI